MNRLTLEITLALIAFIIGVSCVFLVRLLRSQSPLQESSASPVLTAIPPIASPRETAPANENRCESQRRRVEEMIVEYSRLSHATYTASSGNIDGRAVCKTIPTYPQRAINANISGVVSVRIVVDEYGRVISARAISGPMILRRAAERAAREALFTPTMLGGEPVNLRGIVTYTFELP